MLFFNKNPEKIHPKSANYILIQINLEEFHFLKDHIDTIVRCIKFNNSVELFFLIWSYRLGQFD